MAGNHRHSDLVLDSKLETIFKDEFTYHKYNFSNRAGRVRVETRVEAWRRVKQLGFGAFGSVWLEECMSGNQKGKCRAVKELAKMRLGVDYSAELEAIAKFSHHRYVHCFVRSFGWYENDTSIFISMEYISGGDLAGYLSNPIPESEAKEITRQIAEGLNFMHQNKFAHRDLKPNNILVLISGPNWWVKISDFGVTKRTQDSTALRTIVGTQGYLAPEVLGLYPPEYIGEEDDAVFSLAVDVWALGVLVHQMITALPLFPSPKVLVSYVLRAVSFPLEELEKRNSSPECCNFIESLLARSARDRPAAKEILQLPWLESLPVSLEEIARKSSEYSLQYEPSTPVKPPTSTGTTALEMFSTWSTLLEYHDFNNDGQGGAKTLARETLSLPGPISISSLVEPPTTVTGTASFSEEQISLARNFPRPSATNQGKRDGTEPPEDATIPQRLSRDAKTNIQRSFFGDPSPLPDFEAFLPENLEPKGCTEPRDVPLGSSVTNVSKKLFPFPAVSQTRMFTAQKSVQLATAIGADVIHGIPFTPAKNLFEVALAPEPLPFVFDDDEQTGLDVTSSFSLLRIQELSKPASLKNEYDYIPINHTQFRLLLLEKGRKNDPIRCALKALSLSDGESMLEPDQVPYRALSYVWGTEEATIEISLQNVYIPQRSKAANGYEYGLGMSLRPRRFYIRPNLHKALIRIRDPNHDQWLWIDAVCIDQANKVEKSHQLPRMLEIYRNATDVCIWLGESEEGEDSSTHPFDFVPHILNLRRLDRMVAQIEEDSSMAKAWISFAALLRRDWFRRRWVIQEIAASSRASVLCGDKAINWIDFSDAIELFLAKLDDIRACFDKAGHQSDLAVFRHLENSGAAAVVGVVQHLLRKTGRGIIIDRIFSAEALVMTFKYFDASDPRDAVYALLSLAKDGHMTTVNGTASLEPSLIPDYRKSTAQVYCDFVKHCVTYTGSVDIICRGWALRASQPRLGNSTMTQTMDLSLPSWIRTVGHSPFDLRAQRTGRLDSDSLVGAPGTRIYNASRGRTAQVRFELYAHPSNPGRQTAPKLFARGIVLGNISKVSSRVVDGTISDDCLSMAGWDEGSNLNQLSDRVWRTLVADRDSDGRHTPYWFRRACAYCLSKTTPDGDLNTTTLLADKTLPDTVASYLRRVQAVVWGRKFFACQGGEEQDSLFGLGIKAVREHDIVCILFGCSVPVILREKTSLKGRYYELMGECYVHGLMDGEVFAGQDEGQINHHTVEFEIR